MIAVVVAVVVITGTMLWITTLVSIALRPFVIMTKHKLVFHNTTRQISCISSLGKRSLLAELTSFR